MKLNNVESLLQGYPLLSALRERRSRRFSVGMHMAQGPMAYASHKSPFPLNETEEAAMAFAGCGITGYALGDVVYERGQGGTMMGGFLGRTVSSPDAVQTVSLVVTNDQATYLLKRPEDYVPTELPELVELAQRGEFTEIYRRSRVKILDRRAAPSCYPPVNLDVNKWDLYAPGTTYFLPVNDYTYMYINGLLEFLNETMAVYVRDERAGFRSAGLSRFARSKSGHLDDNPNSGRTATIEFLERLLQGVVLIEQGMMLQNLGLMAQAIGLSGFPNFAWHESAWFEALGFRMNLMPTIQYRGAGHLMRILTSLGGQNEPTPYPIGLERDGKVLLKPYCPPYYESMEAAVRAVVDRKFGQQGMFRGGVCNSAWIDPQTIADKAPPLSDRAIDATISYCAYVYDTYGRFPAYPAPFSTAVGFQAGHLDLEFYQRFYQPSVVSESHRQHISRWHDWKGAQ